jgi:capping protein alpha
VSLSFPSLPSADDDAAGLAKAVVKQLAETEAEYQIAVNEAYAEFGDKTFRELRRGLPVTKQKLDWGRVRSRSSIFILLCPYLRLTPLCRLQDTG